MSLPHLPFDPSCCLIGGQWRHPTDLEKLELKNPSDGSTLTEIASGNENDIGEAIENAKNAFDQCWNTTPAAERGRILSNLGRLILKNIDLLSKNNSYIRLDIQQTNKDLQAPYKSQSNNGDEVTVLGFGK